MLERVTGNATYPGMEMARETRLGQVPREAEDFSVKLMNVRVL